MPLGTRLTGRRWRVGTREPGDLPSAVVTREHVGRVALTGAEPARCAGWGDLVRGDVPPTSLPRSSHVCETTGPPAVEKPPRNPRRTPFHVAFAFVCASTVSAQISVSPPIELPAVTVTAPPALPPAAQGAAGSSRVLGRAW